MTRVIGFVIIDKVFLKKFTGVENSLQSLLFRILFPRLSLSKEISHFYILHDPGMLEREFLTERTLSEKIIFQCISSQNYSEEILKISKMMQAAGIVLVHPEHILVSPVELDHLCKTSIVHNKRYSCNHRPYANTRCPTGLGGQFFDIGYFADLKNRSNISKDWKTLEILAVQDYETGVPVRNPHNCSPEINLSINSPEDIDKIDKVIQKLQSKTPGPLWGTESILKVCRDEWQITTVVIVENALYVREAIAWGNQAGGIVKYVSLTPAASYEFERQGALFQTRAYYFDQPTVYASGIERFGVIERLCGLIDNQIRNLIPEKNIDSSRNSIFGIKILFDVLFADVSVINTIINNEKPNCIRIYSGNNLSKDNYPIPFKENDSLYSAILSLPGWPVPVVICASVPLESPKDAPLVTISRQALHLIKKYLESLPSVYNTLVILKHHGLGPALISIGLRLKNFRGSAVLLYSKGYNWDDSLLELFRAGIRTVIRIDDWHFSQHITKDLQIYNHMIDICNNEEEIRNQCKYGEIDLSPLIVPRLAYLISCASTDSAAAYSMVNEIIRNKKIQCLLLSTRATPAAYSVVIACRMNKLPIISWQHGGAGYSYHPIMTYVEMSGSDIHLVFGEGVAKSYRDTYSRFKYNTAPEIIPVGSASIDRMTKRSCNCHVHQKKQILYVTTNYFNNIFYFSSNLVDRDYNETLWAFQRKILDLCKRHNDYTFVVKLHSSHHSKEPLSTYIRDHNIGNVKLILDEKSIYDLACESEIILYDLVSTGFLETALLEKEHMIYTGLYPMDTRAKDFLKKRAHIAEDQDACVSMLDMMLNNEQIFDGVDTGNTEFIEHFGTHMNDQRSAERAAEIVHTKIV